MDWCNTLIGGFSFLTGCCLAVMSLKLDASGMFAVLYMLLGTTGSIFIILLRQKKMDEAESVPLNKLNHNTRQNSEKSAEKCKVLVTEFVNTTHSKDERKLEDTASNNIGLDSLLNEVGNTEISQEMDVTKSESSTSVFQENVDNSKSLPHSLKEGNLHVLPLITVGDIEYDFELPEFGCSWVNSNNQILPYDIGNQYLDDFTMILDCDKINRYEGNKLSSNKIFSDNIAKPPVKSELYSKKTLKQFFKNKTILERKLSSEPSCISCLCANLLPEPVTSNTLNAPQQSLLRKAHW